MGEQTIKLAGKYEVWIASAGNPAQLASRLFHGSHGKCRMWLRRNGFTRIGVNRYGNPAGDIVWLVG